MATSSARINMLQALRAYAALPVVLFHTGYVVTGINKIGIFGVHMFFLLSGYIMASICATDTHAFLRRRAIRILPSYWFMTILLYCAAALYPSLMNTTRADPGELVKSLLFIPFMKENGLFQPILFVGWTVNYEVLFYSVLALSLVLWRRRPLVCASLILIALMAVSSLFANRSGIARFYSNPVIFEFIFGLLAFTAVDALPKQKAVRLKYLWLSVFLIALVTLPAVEAFGIWGSAPMIARFGPLSFLLISSSCILALNGSDIRFGLLVLIGDASYTLYLVHPYIEMLLDRIVAKRLPLFHIATTFGCIFSVIVAVAISIFLYVKVEKPMLRALTWRFCQRRKAPAPAVVETSPGVLNVMGTVSNYATGRAAE